MHRLTKLQRSIFLVISIFCTVDVAVAQGILEEIVVTARKRGENLQEVPVAIKAMAAEEIERLRVSSMRDFAELVPNLFMIETQNSAFAFVNIRGISAFRNIDPSIALVVDGVLSTSPNSFSQELFDVEQIEVLKGPQGALYGRNAMGGAINITTKQPTNEVEGFVRAGYGNGESYKLQSSISGPLIEDKLLGRIAASYYDSEGVRDNITLGIPSDPWENFSVRGKLLYLPTENISADLRFSISQDDGAALQFADNGPVFGPFISPVTGQPTGVSIGTAFGIFGPNSLQALAGPVVGGDPSFQNPANFINGNPFIGAADNNSVPVQGNLNGIDDRDIYNVSLKVDLDLGFATLTSVSSWDKVTAGQVGENPPRTPVAAAKNSQFRTSEAFSQEIRITSPDDQRLRWIFGGYVVQTDTFLSIALQRDADGIDNPATIIERDPLPVACPLGSNPFNPADPAFNTNCVLAFDGDDGDNLAYAVFAQFNYDLFEDWELSFSARFDKDERDQQILTPNRFLSFPTTLQFGDVRSASFSSFQPKFTVRWTPLDNAMLYATYAKGFRSGGFNRPGIQDRAAVLVGTPQVPGGIFDLFPKQETDGLEGGFKYATENGRFILNSAVFFTQIDNFQSFFFSPPLNNSQIVIPIEDVEIFGAEFDARLAVTEHMALSVGLGVMDSEIKEFSGTRAFEGNEAPNTPDITVNIGFEYQHPVNFAGIEGDVFLRVDYNRIGEVAYEPGNFDLRSPLDLLNLRAGINFGAGWSLIGWARNATNEDYLAEVVNTGGLNYPGKLRMYGFELTKRF